MNLCINQSMTFVLGIFEGAPISAQIDPPHNGLDRGGGSGIRRRATPDMNSGGSLPPSCSPSPVSAAAAVAAGGGTGTVV